MCKIHTGLVLIALSLCTASGAKADSTPNMIYFGYWEVTSGHGQLKSANGQLPRAGEQVLLRVDLLNLSSVICDGNMNGCVGRNPRLFVRFNGSQQFQEVPGLPSGGVNGRGPSIAFGDYDIPIQIPADSDRIETYMRWQISHWSAYGCHMDYDMTQCDISISNPDGDYYLSNYGQNFGIPVLRM